MVGGDISYDNNMATCYNVWDLVLVDLPYEFKELGAI